MSRRIFSPQFARRIEESLFGGSVSYFGKNANKMIATPTTSSPAPTRTSVVDSFSGDLVDGGEVYISPLDKKTRQSFVDVADFETVARIYDDADRNREVVIKTSRDIVKGAKKAIYDLHRNQIEEAKSKIREAELAIDGLTPVGKVYPRLLEDNMYRGSLEELVEAKCFCHYLETGKLLTFRQLDESGVYSVEDYIGGVCDFTGELGRHAVHCSIARRFDEVVADYHMVDQILGSVAQVTIRNKSGAHDDLRRKFDQIKWTLKKVEQLVYDISFQRSDVAAPRAIVDVSPIG